MAFEIDDDAPMPTGGEARPARAERSNSGRDFWNAHAEYWDERGNTAKAEECRREARASRHD
jgi:hypothetical protein